MSTEVGDAEVAHDGEAGQLEEGEATGVVDDLGHKSIRTAFACARDRVSTGASAHLFQRSDGSVTVRAGTGEKAPSVASRTMTRRGRSARGSWNVPCQITVPGQGTTSKRDIIPWSSWSSMWQWIMKGPV